MTSDYKKVLSRGQHTGSKQGISEWRKSLILGGVKMDSEGTEEAVEEGDIDEKTSWSI